MNFKLKDGKLVGVPDESLTPNLDNYQNEADYLSDLNKHMEYCRIYGEFENLRVGGVLPAPGKFHTELFPSEKKAGGHVYGTYEDYIEYYNKYASLPAYSLSEEMKEWVKSNPKDSYELGKDFEVLSWEDDEPHKKKSFAVPIKPQNNKILSNENGI